LKDPSLDCVERVFDELQKIINNLEIQELVRFHQLRDRMIEVANHLLVKCREPTKLMITNLINIELAYINTAHPDFIGGGGALGRFFERSQGSRENSEFQQDQNPSRNQQQHPPLPPRNQNPNQGYPQNNYFNNDDDFTLKNQSRNPFQREPPKNTKISNKDQLEIKLIKDLLSSYFNIVRKNVMDCTPKAVMYFLVNESKKALQHELVSDLYKEDLFNELLKENDSIGIRRDQCKKTLEILRKANDILNSVRDYNYSQNH